MSKKYKFVKNLRTLTPFIPISHEQRIATMINCAVKNPKKKQISQGITSGEDRKNDIYKIHDLKDINNILLLNNLHDPIFVKDEKHRWVFLNDAMCEFMGASREYLIGKSDFDFFPKEEAEVFWKMDNLVFKTGEDNINEEKFTDAKGRVNYIKTRKKLVVDDSGKKYILGTIFNITELVLAKKSEKQYLQNLEFLSQSAMQFVELSAEDNIYEFAGTKLRELINNSIIFISSFNRQNNAIKIEAINADEKDLQIINKEFGVNPKDFEFKINSYIYGELLKGILGTEIKGICELAGHQIDEDLCHRIEKELNVNSFYAIGMVYNNNIAGSASFLLRKPLTRMQKDVIEAFTRQASVVIQKNAISKHLLASELKYRTIFDNILNVYVELDISGRVLEISPSVEIYSFFKRTELLNIDFRDLFTDYDEAQNFFNNISKHEMLRDYEVNLIDKLGKSHVCLINIRTEKNAEGVPLKYIGVVNDISERKQTEEMLDKSKERNREILENANDIIFTMDFKGRLTSINQIVEKIIGEQIDYKRIYNIKQYLLPDSYKKALECINRMLENPEERAISTFEVKTANGGIVTLETNSYLRFKNGKPFEVFGIARDITDRRRNEEQIRTSLVEKEVLLSEIHHRVKNNMQIIISLINMHIKEIKDRSVAGELNELKNRVMTMSMIHEDLYMAKNLSEIEFGHFIQKLSKNLLITFNGTGNIHIHCDAGKILLNIEKAIPCGLVVNELISNAIKYAFPDHNNTKKVEKNRISIKFKKLKKHFCLVISDNGIGLPKDIDITNPKTMGLSLVDILINHQIKGNVIVDVSKGTTYKITFPCSD